MINKMVLELFENQTFKKNGTTMIAPTYVHPGANAATTGAGLGVVGGLYGTAFGARHGGPDGALTGGSVGTLGGAAVGAGLGYLGAKLHNYQLKSDLQYSKRQR